MLTEVLTVFSPGTLLLVMAAIVFAQVVASIPGLSGPFLLAIMLPFVHGMDPIVAIAVLVGAVVTTGTGNTVTSVIFGVPGSDTGIAVVFDGYPMARQGLAGRAIGAGIGASVVGGVIGAGFLAALIPVVRPIVLSIGGPEFFLLIVVALYAIAYVREESLLKGLVSGGLGLSLAFIGMEGSSGVARFTFGQLYLWDGLRLVPVLIGLFAIAEMLGLVRDGGTIAQEGAADGSETVGRASGAWEGVKDVFRHWRVTLQSSLVGVGVGILPGLGAGAAQFIAYAQAVRSSKDPDSFGKGNVQGVIAADAVTNSKDGGALVPTMAFGIPGSASMAILLSAFIMLGVQPGPSMLEDHIGIVWMIVAILVFANVFAGAVVLAFTRFFARLTYVRVAVLAPAILVISLFGAYTTTRHIGDVWTAVGFGVVGYFMAKYGYSRATFVIGFVLAPLLEHYFLQSLQLFGPAFVFGRPIALGLLLVLVGSVAWSLVKSAQAARRRARMAEAAEPVEDPGP